jgi:2-polyprenyl-6-methoxyphenol hydroxylase-like FAD-dependent oxidoreductase
MALFKLAKRDNRGSRTMQRGDAAHLTTAHREQGLNHALQDARNFVSAMRRVACAERRLKEVVHAFDEEVLKRERGTSEMGMETLDIHNWNALMKSPGENVDEGSEDERPDMWVSRIVVMLFM